MRIVLTGATGFLGSHLLKALLKEKHEVIILKRSFSKLTRIEKEINQVKAYDIDQHGLEKAFQENTKIDAIIHTATCYGRNQEDIVKIQQTNTQFPLQLLQLAVKYKIKCFYNTDTVLKKHINEYALSKKQFSQWGKLFVKKNDISFINLQLELFYGPYDDDNKFITFIVAQCKNNVPSIKLTKGEQKRDFIFISDVVNAYLYVINKRNNGYKEYRICTERLVKIKEVVKFIHKTLRSSSKLEFGAVPDRKQEVSNVNNKTQTLQKFGWTARVNIYDGIKMLLNTEEYKKLK